MPEMRSRALPAIRRLRSLAGAPLGGFARDVVVVYVVLLSITAVLKMSLLRAVYADELSTAVGVTDGSAVTSIITACRLFAADTLQMLPVALGFVLLGRLFHLRLRWILLIPASLMIAMGALSWLSYRELGLPLSLEVFWLSTTWVGGHLDAFTPVAARLLPVFGILLVLLLLIAGPVALSKVPALHPRLNAFTGLVVALLWSASLVVVISRGLAADSIATRSYWATTLAWLFQLDEVDPLRSPPTTRDELRAEYSTVAFPSGRGSSDAPVNGGKPVRYIVVIVMETAPARYYPLGQDPAFPTFARMARGGVIALEHYSTMPYTAEAIYSIVTGMYPVHRIYRLASRAESRSSLAALLRDAGFETTFIDTFDIDWSPASRMGEMWRGLGFGRLETGHSPKQRGVRTAEPEAKSFAIAVRAVESARARGKGAFVVLATALGHFPWTDGPTRDSAGSLAVMHSIGRSMDSLTGALIARLDTLGVLDESLIIVTGDHGLRFREEFEAAGASMPDMELTFHVPFILYAPGAVTRSVRIEAPTSHVDIAPTIAALAGLPTDSLLLHGLSILSPSLPDRVLFGFATGLSPADYVIRDGQRYTVNHLTGTVRTRRTAPTLGPLWPADSARQILANGRRAVAHSTAFQLGGGAQRK